MKLRLNSNEPKKEENVKKVEEIKRPTQEEIERQKFEEAKEMMYNELVEDMAHNALDLEISKESIEIANKKRNAIKRKKTILYILMMLLFFIIFGCAIYKTFFKHEFTGQEIAGLANYYNGKTNFPEYGVQGYIESNIEDLLVDRVTYGKDVQDVEYGTPIVTRINAKNNIIANVYFYLPVTTTFGQDEFTCMLPLYFDKQVNKYHPCGDIIVTPLGTAADNTDRVSNPLMSFEGISMLGDNEVDSAKTFVNNFFTMFYEGQDISPYYSGKELYSGGLEYNGLDEFEIYSSQNANGYNARCTVSLSSKSGITIKSRKYLTINQSGGSWTIVNVL